MTRKGKDGAFDATVPSARGSDPARDDTAASDEHGPNPGTMQLVPGAAPSELALAPGTLVGRYSVIERLGSGTMGVVMLALDASLDRRVAIKLVRPDRAGSTVGRQRLLREAQAMAQLSHPNVVTVYEVGMFGDHVFLAMEYVPGSTLADWLVGEPRSRAAILEHFRGAGLGLAAAHRAGIVHRDFKPANVLVSTDGRVRVADFGLATAPAERVSAPPAAFEGLDSGVMTKTGAIMGTPAYMSPEQHLGEPADARADQFSFCVALYEALYKALPFEGKSYLVYSENVLATRMTEVPRGSDVPARLRRVLLRGMARAAADRYPTMDALLADLSRDPAAKWRRIAAITAGVAAAAAVGALWSRGGGHADDDPCAAATQPLATLWSADARRAMGEAFAASKTPGAAALFERAAQVVDTDAEALRAARHEACVATAVRREQSEDLLDRRMACVDRRASELTALVAVLSEHPDPKMVAGSIEAVSELTPIARCADRDALRAAVPPPTPAQIRAGATELESQIERADALLAAGKPSDALAMTAAVVAKADGVDYMPLRARAHYFDAKAHEALEHWAVAATELRATGELAAAARDDELLADTWIALYGVAGHLPAHGDDGRVLETTSATAVVRAGNSADQRARLDNSRGNVAFGAGDFAAAAAHFETAVEEQTEASGPTDLSVARELFNAGTALEAAGKPDGARAAFERSLAIRVARLGPDHPDVARTHAALGALLETLGKRDEAAHELDTAIAIDTRALPDSGELASDLVSKGVVLGRLGKGKEGLAEQERALAILKLHPADHADEIIAVLTGLADTQRDLGDMPAALPLYQQVLELAEARFGPDHPKIADILNSFGYAEALAGDLVHARPRWQRALAIQEAKLGPDHPGVAKTLGFMASDAADDLHDQRAAIQLASRAIAILDRPNETPDPELFDMLFQRGVSRLALGSFADAVPDLTRARDGYGKTKEGANARLRLGDALWAQGGAKRAAAVTEGQTALAELEAAPDADADAIAAARAWLAKHPALRP